jgi:alpha/beta superfamily hydrolase
MMHFKVIFRAAKALQENGVAALRFNFRGVGRSEGVHDDGRGERDDVRAALDFAAGRFASLPLVLGGFSFGAAMALHAAAADARARALFVLGLPLTKMNDLAVLNAVEAPRLFVQGERDEFGDGERIRGLVEPLPPPRELRVIPDSDHFFTGHLTKCRASSRAGSRNGPGGPPREQRRLTLARQGHDRARGRRSAGEAAAGDQRQGARTQELAAADEGRGAARDPTVLTTQYRKGLGELVPEVRAAAPGALPLDKLSFGCFGDELFLKHLKSLGREQLLVTGIESHICVTQTVLGALEHGYQVHVASDATGSRSDANWGVGLGRMEKAGALLSSAEMALYELLRRSDAAAFKQLLPLLKS